MIDDALERLRESNPVPDEVQPPPLDFVLRQLGDAGSTRRRSRARVGASLMPAAGIAAAVAVAVAVVAIVLPGHHSGPAGTQPRQLPTHATIPTPRFGRPGV